MSAPINAYNNYQIRPDILQANVGLITPSDQFVNPFRPFPGLQVDPGFFLPPAPTVSTPQTETYNLHDEHEQETGETVSFDPSDPSSLFSTAEQLAKSPSTQDKLKAQELFMKFQEIMQLKIQEASILHQIAMSAIQAMRG